MHVSDHGDIHQKKCIDDIIQRLIRIKFYLILKNKHGQDRTICKNV